MGRELNITITNWVRERAMTIILPFHDFGKRHILTGIGGGVDTDQYDTCTLIFSHRFTRHRVVTTADIYSQKISLFPKSVWGRGREQSMN